LSRQAVYNLVHRYLQSHQVESLHDRPHPGRTPDTADLQASQILRELRRSPLKLGYRTNVWTVETLKPTFRTPLVEVAYFAACLAN
jgi:hypothetical protein